MHDGWYRIRKPGVHGKVSVEFVYQNHSDSGAVTRLVKEGCTYEQVVVLTPQEMYDALESAQNKALEKLLKNVKSLPQLQSQPLEQQP